MKLLLPFSIAMFALSFSLRTASASSSLEISDVSDFSILSTNFNGGEMIYVRTTANNDGADKSALNLRDNNYNLVQSFNLAKEGSYFTAVLTAPSSSGFYSLEARIESGSASSTSVKTIKVGSSANSNIKVNVESSVEGEKATNENDDSLQDASPTPEVEYSETSDDIDYDHREIEQKTFGQNLVSIFKLILDFLWPF